MIKNRVSEILQEHGYSIREVARITGIDKNTITKLKNNPSQIPSGNVLNSLCEFFGITPGEVIIYVPDRPSGEV
ncbi:helix-turn-helix transcriptional regulator [bacterium]|nr:helix-turn-helix transcriptional regulator [bacterium]